ncbi:hypothetical protein K431DRAFT_282519 [Polychaeton citri CBS 116435]|uniref:Uncharacterized protein n=1 Tax=Polychaeton citri CBS 116435 TaxID=1314669 RepID=A0A9P4UT75_9PEZI|nr:hypothetical protein K431DRAFT_282519 [Polychaeton citri CBS 116435]
MTGRGNRGPAPPPVPPADPTLSSHPVPRRRTFQIRSFGPGSAADIQDTTRPFSVLDQAANRESYTGPGDYRETEDVRRLLEEVDNWAETQFRDDEEPGPVDRTWGYYVFLTSYSDATRGQLPQAMENWVTVQQRMLSHAETLPELREEARRRFKLDLIEDQQELENASDDRIRENFRAFLKNQDLTREEDRFPPQARFNVCLVLDEAKVKMLAGLQFLDEHIQEFIAFRRETVKAIDANWDRSRAAGSSYHGVGNVSINGLQRLYLLITSGANTGAMEDLHPLNGFPR